MVGSVLLQERFPDVVALAGPGRAGEEGAGGVADVLVEPVVGGEALLERDELLVRVALEGGEEEASVKLPALGVEAVGKGVAAAQDLLLLALAG